MEGEWVFDFLQNVLNSPTWEVPIMSFIDENCVVFDHEDENKFAYTDLHQQFKELVDTILEGHLAEVGVTSEQFAEICEISESNGLVQSEEILNQIFAMDDFMTFKKLMVKRNMELELEAIQALQDEGTPILAAEDKADAEVVFQKALRKAADEDQASADAKEAADDDAEELDDDAEEVGALLDAQLRASIDASIMEMEILQRQQEMEQAELETAIAMSLAMEDARVREESKEEMELAKKRDIEHVIEQGRKAREDQRIRQEQLRSKIDVSEEEMERRAKYLRQQRDKIIAKRKKEREEQLKSFEKEKNCPPAPPAAVQEVINTKVESGDAKKSEDDERRAALRIALGRRMKQDLLENAEASQTTSKYEQYTDLDQKLRQVENLRRENLRQEEQAYRKVLHQQEKRARNMKKSIEKGLLDESFSFE